MFEIETATLAISAAAQKSLYIESQYFASRRIAEAMAVRLREPDGPEIVLIKPKEATAWLESKTMDAARLRLMKRDFDADAGNRWRNQYPVNEPGQPI